MNLSIVMPTWIINEELKDLTAVAWESLKKTFVPEGDNVEFIIIDNGSTIILDTLFMEATHYLKNQGNLGFPKAVNQAFKLASGDYVCVANNDIKVSDNWWIVAREIFERVKDAGTVHFRMLSYDQPNVPAQGIFPTGKERWCHGSFYVIKKKVVDKLGGYDENFGIGGYDDYDLWKRIRKAGFKQVYTNGAFFQHKDSSSQLLRDPNERAGIDNKNREYYKKKHGKYPDTEFTETFSKQMEAPWRPYP